MSDYHLKRAAEILQSIKYATLATVTPDGKPWNSPVAHSFGADGVIHWFSDKESQHSQNIRENGNVAIVIYDSTAPEGKGEGVYIEAKASELQNPEEIVASGVKKNPGSKVPDEFIDDAISRIYKAEPQRVWMNDAEIKDGKFIRDYRVELPLDQLR